MKPARSVRSSGLAHRRRGPSPGRPRLRYAYYELRAFYDGGWDGVLEQSLRMIPSIGRNWVGSGQEMFGKLKRDWQWEFTSEAQAMKAAKRVLAEIQELLESGKSKKKVRVEVWDTKPRRIFVDGGPK